MVLIGQPSPRVAQVNVWRLSNESCRLLVIRPHDSFPYQGFGSLEGFPPAWRPSRETKSVDGDG